MEDADEADSKADDDAPPITREAAVVNKNPLSPPKASQHKAAPTPQKAASAPQKAAAAPQKAAPPLKIAASPHFETKISTAPKQACIRTNLPSMLHAPLLTDTPLRGFDSCGPICPVPVWQGLCCHSFEGDEMAVTLRAWCYPLGHESLRPRQSVASCHGGQHMWALPPVQIDGTAYFSTSTAAESGQRDEAAREQDLVDGSAW